MWIRLCQFYQSNVYCTRGVSRRHLLQPVWNRRLFGSQRQYIIGKYNFGSFALKFVSGLAVAYGIIYSSNWTAYAKEIDVVLPLVEADDVSENVPKGGSKRKGKSCKSIKNSGQLDLPNHVPYVIVGGGTAAFSAVHAIKKVDPSAKILIVTDEPYDPYERPPLSKQLWFKTISDDKQLSWYTTRKDGSRFTRTALHLPDVPYKDLAELSKSYFGISVLRNTKVSYVNAEKKFVALSGDRVIKYGKCLIATGSTPVIPNYAQNIHEDIQSNVFTFRSGLDFEKLYNLDLKGKTIAVSGGGFLGSELSCALNYHAHRVGFSVVNICRGAGLLHSVLPTDLGKFVTNAAVESGLRMLCNTEINSIKKSPRNTLELSLSNCDKLEVDYLVVCNGVRPNSNLFRKSVGIEIDRFTGGFLAESDLKLSSDIWCAGDACSITCPDGKRVLLEHYAGAMETGRIAGNNMAGGPILHASGNSECFGSLNMNGQWHTYEGFGDCSSKLDTHTTILSPELKECYDQEAVVMYHRGNTVVGVLLWNCLLDKTELAWSVVNSDKAHKNLSELGKLFMYEPEPEEEFDENVADIDLPNT